MTEPQVSTRHILTPLIIACALFMEHLDGSIIATALPTISRSLSTDPLHLNLAITSYLFSLAIFIPLSGWMADRFGARRIFQSAIIVFTLGSICCGFSISLWTLVLSRILQGIGGAMMVPVGRLVLLRSIPRKDLVNAMAWVTAPALVGPVLGPPVGGLIVTYASWRWIFFLNIPFGILGFILAGIYIDDIQGRSREPLDKLGFLLISASMTGFVFGFETLGRNLVPIYAVISLFAVGILSLGLYLRHVRDQDKPIVDMSMFRYATFRTSIVGGLMVRIGVGALPFLLPLMLQYGFGLSPANSGFITFAAAAGAILMKTIATNIIRNFGFRNVLIVNSVLNAVFIGGCALFTPNTPHSAIFIFLLIGGLFRSLQFTALNTVAYADIPDNYVSTANTLYNMFQQLGLSFGVAVGTLLLDLTLTWHGEIQIHAHDFWPAFLIIGFFTLISAQSYRSLSPEAGDEMSGHKQKIQIAQEAERKEPA